ncbi:MAG: hypothetical protein N4A35_05245 [Flavobacteriales bacterium]|jgi:DNA-binding GntR family transcriptional regulator|nr:hypothetical protein [Flavobacteriales bacterium]
MKIIRNEIKVPSGYLLELVEEFKTSRQTVYNALRDITKSPLAKDIRKKAKEMLQKDINDIEI